MNWDRFYEGIEEWTVEIEVSMSQDQINDKKRADIQDMMVVLAQNAQDIPGAAELVQKLANMLLQDQVPLAGTTPVMPQAAPAQLANPLPQNPAVGSPNQ